MIEHKHTDKCLEYAALTGKAFCIADCRDSRVTPEARLRECVHAILKLPEPPKNIGDGPDERVGNILEIVQAVGKAGIALASGLTKKHSKRLEKVNQEAERSIAERDMVIEDYSKRIDERDEIIAHLEGDLEERNRQYHMACTKTLSRDSLIKGLADDYNELEQAKDRKSVV